MIETASWFARGLLSLTTLLAAGSLLLALITAKQLNQADGLLRRSCACYSITALLLAGCWTVMLVAELGDEWQAVLDPYYYKIVWLSPAAELLMWRCVALSVLLLCTTLVSLPRWMELLAAIVLVLSFTRYGHSLTDPQWIKSFLLMAHLSVIAWWLAVVPALIFLLHTSVETTLELAVRFASQAKWAVPIAVLSGSVFFGIELANRQWDWQSLYFTSMLIKLLVVAAVLVIGTINRDRLFPQLRSNPSATKTRLKTVLLVDSSLFFTVVILSAWLTGPASNS